MKRSPEMQKLVDRMAPGVLCREGFLGSDRRPLEEILDADRSAVVSLGLTDEQLAERLAELMAKAVAQMGRPVAVGGLVVTFHEGMGRIPCPWGRHGTFPKGEVDLLQTATGRRLRFTALSVHLLTGHGFYQGRGSRYRLEPTELADMFGLGRGRSQ